MRVDEDLGVVLPIDRVRAEEPGEEQDLRGEEEPHPELPGIELLLDRIVVVPEV